MTAGFGPAPSPAPPCAPASPSPKSAAIIGSGDFGRALAKALLRAGYDVTVGSRHPDRRSLSKCDKDLAAARIVSISDAIKSENLVFVAVPAKVYKQLSVFEEELAGKTLVDVSNTLKKAKISNAESLQVLLPRSHVVKAFNTISAYGLISGHKAGDSVVYVAADDPSSRDVVMEVVRDLNYTAVANGGLSTSRELEKMPTEMFRGWGGALIVTFVCFAFWFTYGVIRYHYIKDHAWSRVPMNTMNKAQACTSITLLALCYLPGCVAAAAQLINGTKHKRFPRWLDNWMKMRKQVGLLALWTGCVHAVLSLAQLNPGYYGKWYGESEVFIPGDSHEDITIQLVPRMTWIGECVVAFGVFSLGIMVLLGITSLPSVGAAMNWRQWTFVQSYLGHFALALAAVHVSFNACPGWGVNTFFTTVQKLSFLCLLLPYLVLFLRLLIILPCFSIPLGRIRSGWERGAKNDIEADMMTSRYSPTPERRQVGYDNQAYNVNGQL